jgi:hypothetical protein
MLVLLLATVGVIFAMYVFGGAASVENASTAAEPAHVEHIEGSEISRVRLTPEAAKRLAVETAGVRRAGERRSVPYSAVLYDPSGKEWVYTSPEPLVFVREEIVVDHISGDRAFLANGPAVGTTVASVGVPELYGTEFEVGH